MGQSAMMQLLTQLKDERENLPLNIEWDRCYQSIEMLIENTYIPLEKDNIITAINEVSKRNIKYANNIIASFTKIEGELFMHDDKQAIEYYNKAYKK